MVASSYMIITTLHDIQLKEYGRIFILWKTAIPLKFLTIPVVAC